MSQQHRQSGRRSKWPAYLLLASCLAPPTISGCSAQREPPNGVARTPDDQARKLGEFNSTYYWFLLEDGYEGPADTQLVNAACQTVASVRKAFADEVCVEGSGKLTDGRVINLASESCSCGYACPPGHTVCFESIDLKQFPWGMGSDDNPLEPLRSWAIDPALIEFGTILYAPAWDGVRIPKVGELGGFVHDGCFRADDVGYEITGRHFDFFAGSPQMWTELEKIRPTHSKLTVVANAPQCAHIKRPISP